MFSQILGADIGHARRRSQARQQDVPRRQHPPPRIRHVGLHRPGPAHQARLGRMLRLHRCVNLQHASPRVLSPNIGALQKKANNCQGPPPPPTLGLLFPQARRFRKLSQSAPSGALRRPRTTASPGQNLTSSRTSLVSRSVPDQNIPSFCWVGVASDWCSLSLISCAYSQLYGADDEADQQELDDAEKNGENGTFPLRPISDSRAVVNAQS